MPKTVHVVKAFTLQLSPDRQPIRVEAGVQQLPDEVADHWYTKVHTAQAGMGAVEYASALRQTTDAAYVELKEKAALYAEREKQTLEAEDSAGVEPSDPAFERIGGWPDFDALKEQAEAARKAFQENPPEPKPPPDPDAPPVDPTVTTASDPKVETEGDPEAKPHRGRRHKAETEGEEL